LRPARLFDGLGHRGRQAVQQLIVDLQLASRIEDGVRESRDAVITHTLRSSVDELGDLYAAARRW
jgi:hypothetical protein